MIRKHTSELPPEYENVLGGFLSPQQGMSSGCRWRSWNSDMESTCKYIDSQQECPYNRSDRVQSILEEQGYIK
jgi:hypothetical protein